MIDPTVEIMSLAEVLDQVNSLEGLFRFPSLLEQDFKRVSDQPVGYTGEQDDWQNGSIDAYLNAIAAWANNALPSSQRPDWQLIAILFYMGKIYE